MADDGSKDEWGVLAEASFPDDVVDAAKGAQSSLGPLLDELRSLPTPFLHTPAPAAADRWIADA